jgi:endonuclease G
MVIFVFQIFSFGQQEVKTNDGRTVLLFEDGSWHYADSVRQYNVRSATITNLEIPATNSKDVIITHSGYSLLYNETNEQANWVAYELTKEETNKVFDRTDKFLQDPQVATGTANDQDYSGSGYDRGHLAPAADMGWSSTTMAESFYYSNMSPQLPAFNRGIWKKLEELVRGWAVEYDSLYIVTGPVLTTGLGSIGTDKVSVPNYFYKVVLDYAEPDIKGIGFIIPNAGSSEPLQDFTMTIDSVEKFTGIDFYPSLPDYQEKLIEKTLCINCWLWNSIKTENVSSGENKSSTSVQCKGITQSGERCQNKTLNVSGYCYLHESQQGNNIINQSEPKKADRRSTSVQCSGTTQAGSRCKRMTYSPNGRCYQHGGD